MASNPVSKLTEERYLAIEPAAAFKNEFLDGEIFDKAGASLAHVWLQKNLLVELSTRLTGDCEAFTSDLRVKVPSFRLYTYPDISVVCGKPLLADSQQDVVTNPVLICEVLSPSTESYDRGLKFQLYRTIESLREYVLVDQGKMFVEHFTLQADTNWVLRDFQRPDQELKIDSIGVSIPLHRIYDRVELS